MIIRTIHVVTRPGQEAAYSEFFHNRSLTLARQTEGIVFSLAGTARRETPNEFFFATIWRDMPSLRAFVGDDISKPSPAILETDFVESRTIKHFDLLSG